MGQPLVKSDIWGTVAQAAPCDIDDQIDAAYRSKYRRYGARFVDPMVSPESRSTTIKLVPRSTSSQ